VPGGGRILHVEKERSCGINILKSHCTSPLYYHICTRNRSILAQCEDGQIFDIRRQRCITSREIQLDEHKHYDQNSVPDCTKPGRFSVPGHCSIFYTCNISGRRLYRSVYKCPRNTGYYADKGICIVMPGCENDDSVDFAVCMPDSPDENLGSQNSNKVVKEDVKGIPETYGKHGNANEHTLTPLEEPKLEDKSSIINDHAVSTTPVNVMDDRQSMNNKEDHDNDTDNTPTQSTENVSVSENEKVLYKSYMSTNKLDESSVSSESTTFLGSPNEADQTIEESSTIVNDEQQQIAISYEVTSDVSFYSSRSYTTDPSFVSHDAPDDAPQFNSTTEAIACDSSASEHEVYSTSSLEILRTTQLPIGNVSVADDPDETSTIETWNPAETTQGMLENEQSPSWMPTTETNNDASHSVVSAISTTECSANTDTDSNVDFATTDTSLLSSIYASQPELDEETYTTMTTTRYDNTSSMIPDSRLTETTDQGPVSLNDISTTMSDLSDYSDISTSIPSAMFSEPIADVEQHTTENALTFGTSASPE